MAKRGASGLSLVVGVDKPMGLTSHDVVARCRRIFDEKRVGHAGTLDPAATGVLIVCVGSAARLDNYLTGHDKTYQVEVAFGAATDTDDAQGQVVAEEPVPACVYDEGFAQVFTQTLVGKTMQVPPRYSALKLNGQKACDVARQGETLDIPARPVEIYSITAVAVLDADESCAYPRWRFTVAVSKGTYIRSLARDLGEALGTRAHVQALRRLSSGGLALDCCSSLEALEQLGTQAALDPLELLGCRFAFAPEGLAKRIANGSPLAAAELPLMNPLSKVGMARADCCFPAMTQSCEAPAPGEIVAVVQENRLASLYRFDQQRNQWRVACLFNPGVSREGFAL